MVANRARPETREVRCTHCEEVIEISTQAMSVNCRHCHRRVIIEDLTIKAYHSVVRLATAGTVDVTKNATVIAKVRVNELRVNGNVKGDVVAVERVSVGKKGNIEGDVSCRRLSVQPGAQLLGHYVVTPDFVPSTAGESDDPDDF